jgi:hypothetical protein
MAEHLDPKHLGAAMKQYQQALGVTADPKMNKLASDINALGKEHNVLITYEIKPLPGAATAARPVTCLCVCACACHVETAA